MTFTFRFSSFSSFAVFLEASLFELAVKRRKEVCACFLSDNILWLPLIKQMVVMTMAKKNNVVERDDDDEKS